MRVDNRCKTALFTKSYVREFELFTNCSQVIHRLSTKLSTATTTMENAERNRIIFFISMS